MQVYGKYLVFVCLSAYRRPNKNRSTLVNLEFFNTIDHQDGLIKCEQAASKGNKQPATTSTPALVTLATSKNKQADLQAAPKQQIVATNSSELEGLARQPEVRLTR